ncbi:MAG TPA: FGGY family carbohydrate kinase [Jatrophihabitans sp.]|jgi:sugar (pentulose or hexulose) kinase|uniref:FGGY-family carbohydrate kinase n=1 Tax=Jatrophihabitans sp. TaxID=1932789 RepID=UPI002F11099E
MTSCTDVFIGLDMGTTTSKALVRTGDHRDLVVVDAPTPWHSHPGGRTETSPELLLRLATDLIRRGVHAAELIVGRVRVRGIAVAGFAEGGVLLDAAGRSAAPVLAWFDRRGQEQVDRLAAAVPGFAELFAGKTGLPWNSQASIAKLMWLRDNGIAITPSSRWLSIPEWIVHQLGGEQVREPSLASRTGLIDQNTGKPWLAGFTAAGLPDGLLPPELPAGHCAGRLSHDAVPAECAQATLTVAGHDHPVAALGGGAVGPDELFNSSGTADVVARSIPGILTDQQRRILVASGWSAGRHVLPGATLVLAGVRGGLLLRRVLTALGADSPEGRRALDHASLAVTALPSGLEVAGAGLTGDDVVIHLRDDVTPAVLWAAATRYTAAETRALLAGIEGVVGPHRRAVASGGWTRMASVRAAKASAIDHLTFSPVPQPGVTGAALLAMHAVSDGSIGLGEFIAEASRDTNLTASHLQGAIT